ncbi:hypothetical protein [Pseudomonas baetica]|uniref:hypothetical protein n=1 Tax=Pseudomonas baetica TaxID=674054 RepID=UPI002405D061|nr:hypothetical protein [Pseudomonas baetica]MDF9777873.1 O-antigen/teichoic acid export membrane protein [Pseudomonas baetica]
MITNSKIVEKILSISIRLTTLFSKFFLIILLAKLLPPEDVGVYGLITATAGYLVYILGLEFYCFTTRELASSTRNEWGAIVKNHAALLIFSYIIAIPIIISAMISQEIPNNIITLLIIILIIEHLGQEQSRVLIAISRPLSSNIVLFIRTSAWTIVIAPVLWLIPESRTIESVLYFWIAGGIISIAIAALITNISIECNLRVDYSWIKKGLIISIPILISTLSSRGIFTFDRYMIEAFQGITHVAPYVLFIGISNAMISLLDSGVYAYHYPSMIKSARNSPKEFKTAFQSMLTQTIVVCVIYSIACTSTIKYVLTWIDKPIYIAELNSFYILMLAFSAHALSMTFHYSLYALKKDKALFRCNILMLPIFLITAKILEFFNCYNVVPISLLLVFACSLVWKASGHYLEMKLINEDRSNIKHIST